MSINDKVEVVWKTNCEWHDYSHWPKRREIKLKDDKQNEGKRYPSLQPGDSVLVKFGTRWYDAEVREKWTTKPLKDSNDENVATRKPDSLPIPHSAIQPTSDTSHPYNEFLKEQQQREASCVSLRAEQDVKKQLQEKTAECDQLKKQVTELRKHNVESEKRHDDMCKVVTRLEQCLVAMEERIMSRLDVLESNSSKLSFEIPSSITQGNELPVDLPTIDLNTLHEICSNEELPTQSTPTQPIPTTPALNSVPEELVRSCLTPRKIPQVRQTFDSEKSRERSAIKLLQHFFDKETLATCNTDGSHGKGSLDASKLYSLKVLLFSRYPLSPDEDELKAWKKCKAKINARCRATKYFGRSIVALSVSNSMDEPTDL